MKLELNTAGLRKECKEIYPSLWILKEAKRLGIELIAGSDAHTPLEIAKDFDKAIQIANSAGYKFTSGLV